MNRVFSLCLAMLLLVGCDSTSEDDPAEVVFTFDFREGDHGWTAEFADYPAGEEEFYELVADYRSLPASIDTTESALFLSGNNHSDDLFMFYKRQVGGLVPGTRYRATFTFEIATGVPHGCFGAGGSPGESVYVKAGAAAEEPETETDGSGHYRLTVDKGDQAVGGSRAVVLGNVANSIPCDEPAEFELKELTSTETIVLRPAGDGTVWLFAGTDSGFEATTSLYLTRFEARFTPRD